MNDRAAEALPPIELDNFRFLSVLGQGGMGTVYLGEQKNPRRKVAIKIVAPDDSIPRAFLDALKNEGDLAAQFEHDNLLHVYECGIVDDHYYLAMQYLAGGDLEGRLAEGMSPAEAVRVTRAIASALGHIHERGFVHRDIKPANILFTEAGKPVLADFGIAKDAETVGLMTSAGYSTGTPAYMAPEQIKSQKLDGRSDLYALGIVLYECLTGRLPFWADNPHEIKEAQVNQAPPSLPDELTAFQPILNKLLAKDPDDRYPDAAALIADLEGLAPQSQRVTQTTTHPTPRAPSGPSTGPDDTPSPVTAWFKEMTGRRVFRVLALYVAVAWGLTEIVAGVVERVPGVPEWIATATTIAFVVGLPVIVALAWLFDVGPDGVRRVPTRRRGLFLASVGLAAVASLTWVILEYAVKLPRATATSSPATAQGATTPAEAPVLAVLPLDLPQSDSELSALALGIADDLVQSLASLPGLRVKARSATALLVDEGLGPAEVARRLGATHLVAASLERDGDSVRIRANLLDTDNNLLWVQRFDDNLSQVYPLLQRISLRIGESLGIEGLGEIKRIERLVDPRAYALLTQSKSVLEQGNQQRAIELAKMALELAPKYAEAHSALASYYVFNGWMSGVRDHPHLDLADVELQLAKALDPTMPEPDATRALLEHWRLNWNESYAAAERYLASGDTEKLAEVAMTLNAMGYFKRAEDVAHRAVASDPVSPMNQLQVCLFSTNAGNFDVALSGCEYLASIGVVNEWELFTLGYLQLRLGQPADEIRARLLELAPDQADRIEAIVNPGARPAYLERLAASNVPRDWLALETYLFGTPEQAEAMAWSQVGKNAFNAVVYFFDPWAKLRTRTDFLALMDANGLVDFWRETGPPDFCEPAGDSFVCE